jgi:hypothetical protein
VKFAGVVIRGGQVVKRGGHVVTEVAEDWITLREFARRREVALSAVQKAIESGRVSAKSVTRSASGRLKAIEFNRASAEWNGSTDPVQAARSGQVLGQPVLPVAGDEKQPDPERGGDRQSAEFYKHRAKTEEYKAKDAELDYLQKVGVLVSAEEVRSIAMRRYKSVRDSLLAIPEQEAAILAAETDASAVRDRLANAIKKALHGLADNARSDLAAGGAERLAA